jgi:enoyl-CoA hydratase
LLTEVPSFPEYTTLLINEEGPVVTVTLNRPERRNAIDRVMLSEFDSLFDELESRPDISVVVLRGNGPAFCAGYDLKSHLAGEGADGPAEKRSQYEDLKFCRETADRWTRLWDMPKVTIAEVHGHCIAGGLMLALQCDLVYVAEDARIGSPAARTMALTYEFALWPLTIGLRQTKEMLFTGDLVTGRQAERLGMVNLALPPAQLRDYVRFMARRIALESTGMLQTHKYAVNEVADAMGYRQMIHSAVHAAALQHYMDDMDRFRDLVIGSSTKDAFADRDRAYGGVVTREEAWEAERARLDAHTE